MNENEWTADADGVLLPMHRFVGQYAKEIADVHNAALADERKKVNKLEGWCEQLQPHYDTVQELQKQLAAEREELAIVERSRNAWREQLAAERENISRLQIANVSLRAQLAAERENRSSFRAMNDKPTGEWTADDDGVLLPLHRFIGQYAKEIADVHNAALADEREAHKLNIDAVASYIEQNQQLKQQLAAEREKVDALADALKRCRQAFVLLGDPQHSNLIDAALEKVTEK